MRRNIIAFLFTSVLFLGIQQTWAAPSIVAVHGTASNNQPIQISESGFGSKTKPAPVLWDRVDNIPSYVGLSNGETIPVGGSNPWPAPYGNSSTRGDVKYNTSDAQRGVSTAQYKATKATSAYLDGLTWTKTNGNSNNDTKPASPSGLKVR